MRVEIRRGTTAVQAACTARGWPVKAVGARARAERTLNIQRMSVTLDVSKLSGWLNADGWLSACCRVERRACDAGRGAAQEAGGR